MEGRGAVQERVIFANLSERSTDMGTSPDELEVTTPEEVRVPEEATAPEETTAPEERTVPEDAAVPELSAVPELCPGFTGSPVSLEQELKELMRNALLSTVLNEIKRKNFNICLNPFLPFFLHTNQKVHF
jgi:hypothetical protein